MSDLNSIGGLHYEMMKRCYNEKSVMYNCYGAKGITVCKEWHDRDIFRKWCNENGYVKGLRLQRIKAEENYCPQNCYLGTGSKKKPNGESQYHKNIRKEREQLKKKYGIPDNYCKLRIYRIYSGILSRCNNEHDTAYNHYGGRGIMVCAEWNKKYGFFPFYEWAMNSGYNDSLSIDRIDVNGNYCPENCRWVDMGTQIKNRRNSKNYNWKGEKMNLSDIAKINNVKYGRLYTRLIDKGVSVEEALRDIGISTD